MGVLGVPATSFLVMTYVSTLKGPGMEDQAEEATSEVEFKRLNIWVITTVLLSGSCYYTAGPT